MPEPIITADKILKVLKDDPVEIGHWLGFDKLESLHSEWLKMFLYGNKDMTLQAHRGSYKTTTLSIYFALHMLLRPNETLIYFRKTDGDVKQIAKQTGNIMHTACMKRMCSLLWNKTLIVTKESSTEIDTCLNSGVLGQPQLMGFGIGSSITGKHGDIVVTDDIVNLKDRFSRAERERTKAFYQELQNIKNRGGRIINCGTPWHQDDCFTLMPNPYKFDYKQTGLIEDEEIQSLRNGMTASLFAANYELKHIADEDVMFFEPQYGASIDMIKDGIAHVDAAYYGEDYTAFTVVQIHDGKYYVLGKCWRKHIDDCMDEIERLYKFYLLGKLYTETNADKGYSAKAMKRRGIRVSTYHENMNKFLKISTYLKGDWQNVIFCEGTDDEYIDQICDYNEQAEHDDCPDSLASLIRRLKKKNDRQDPDEYISISGI